jgi:superfamily II DNA or RNA helicase
MDLSNTAHGISIASLLNAAPEQAVLGLVGDEVLGVLRALDPALASGEPLRRLIGRLFDPQQALEDPVLRKHILDLLPIMKARELARLLGVRAGRDVYRDLVVAASAPWALPILVSFFGVVHDPRAPSPLGPSEVRVEPSYGLFEHQRHAARRVQSALAVAPRKVVLHMPTGSGKTRTAMHVVAEHLCFGGPGLVCWLAQSAELLEQAASEFERAWKALGNRVVTIYRFWGRHDPFIEDARDGVLVAGLGKLWALNQRDPNMVLRLGDRSSLIVVDEAHQSIAPTYRSLISALHTKRPRNALLGLTATPGRTWADIDADAALAEFFGNEKVMLEIDGYENPVDYLVEEGYLAKTTFRTMESGASVDLSLFDLESIEEGTDLAEDVAGRLAADQGRNLQIIGVVEDLTLRHRRIVVFATTVAHARILAAVLSARGHDAEVVTGETDTATRERIIRRFKGNNPAPMVICNFGVLTTGFDAPATSAAVIARPTKSLVLFSQMVGRATRGPKAGGNEHAEVVTVVDPQLPGFGSVAEAFTNWEDVWHD